METKRCSKCGRELPLSDFGRDKYNKDGLKCKCKHCEKEYREQNKDKIKAWQQAYHQTTEFKEWQKEYYKRDYVREKTKVFNQNYYKNVQKVQRNTDEGIVKRKLQDKAYRQTDKYKNRTRAYRGTDKYRNWQKEYNQSEIGIERSRRHDAKDRDNLNDRYIKKVLRQCGVSNELITQDIIDFKRAHLQLQREIKVQTINN